MRESIGNAPLSVLNDPVDGANKTISAASNYNVFGQLIRDQFVQSCPTRSLKFIRKLTSTLWRELTDDEKSIFIQSNIASPACLDLVKSLVNVADVSISSCSSDGDDIGERTEPAPTKEDNEPADELYWCADLGLAVMSLRSVNPSVNTPTDGGDSIPEDKDMRVVPVDCTATTCQELIVKMSSLSLLETNLIPLIADPDTADFTIALRYFADWDDCDRDSYEWMGTSSTEFGAMSLVRHPVKGKAWRERVWGECPDCIKTLLGGRCKVYLFFLIADRCFSTEEAWEIVWKLERQFDVIKGGGNIKRLAGSYVEVSPTGARLMDIISIIRDQALDVEDKQFKRSASRIGNLYQVEIGPYCPLDPNESSDCERVCGQRGTGRAHDHHGDGLVYTPDNGLDESTMLRQYLQKGRERIPIRRGLLVTATRSSVGATRPAAMTPGTNRVARLCRNRVCMVEKCSLEQVPVPQRTSLLPLLPTSAPPVRTSIAHQIPSAHTFTKPGAPDAPPDKTRSTKEALLRNAIVKDLVLSDNDVENYKDKREVEEVNSSRTANKELPFRDMESVSHASPVNEDSNIRQSVATTIDAAPPAQLDKATTATMLVPIAFVHDSTETYSIPTTLCHPRPSWDECLLHVLHKHNYDVETALEALATDLETMSLEVHMARIWDEQTINMLFRIARTTNMDVLELYTSVRARLASSSSLSISLRDVLYICGEIFTSTVSGLMDDWYLSPVVSFSTRPQRRTRGVMAPPGSRVSYTQVREGIPNRWPASIKFVRHNLLWMRLNNLPCVILSLDLSRDHSADPALIVFPICSSMLRRAQSVPANSLSSFDGEDMSLGNVEKRTVDFALAMRDFAERELQMYPQCKWYIYPSFIMDLLASHSDFRTWRSKVERSSRGRSVPDTRKIYLDALIEQYEELKDQDERCLEGGGYPWDDSIIVPPTPPPSPPPLAITPRARSGSSAEPAKKSGLFSTGSSTASALPAGKDGKRSLKGSDSLLTATIPHDATTTGDSSVPKATKPREKKEKAPPPPPPPQPAPLPKTIIKSNLFWVAKIGLPCIYYDEAGLEQEDKFHVLPISTVTAKYDTLVSVRDIKELSVANLKNCNEERSRDLGEALLMLYQWQEGRTMRALLNGESLEEQTKDDGQPEVTSVKDEVTTEPFQWPDFILDLVAHTTTWRAWSSGVERNMVRTGKPNVRVLAYFTKLKQEYLEMLQERLSAEEAAAEAEKVAQRAGHVIKQENGSDEAAKKRKRRGSSKGTTGAVVQAEGFDSFLALNAPDKEGSESRSHAPVPISMSNLFWIPKLQLPGIFYDEEGYEKNESFCVFPLSASSPRCYESMRASTLRPLTFDNIANCTDTRSRCFGEALMRIYEWARELEDNHSDNNATVSSPEQAPFVWPDFILDLVAHKDKWKSWKRETERNSKKIHVGCGVQSAAIADVYFKALQELYCDIVGIPILPPPPPQSMESSAAKVSGCRNEEVTAKVPISHVLLDNARIATVRGDADESNSSVAGDDDDIEGDRLRSGSVSSSHSLDIESLSCSSGSTAEDYLYEERKFYNPRTACSDCGPSDGKFSQGGTENKSDMQCGTDRDGIRKRSLGDVEDGLTGDKELEEEKIRVDYKRSRRGDFTPS